MSARKLRWRKDGRKNIPLDEAVWQYILDHSIKTVTGFRFMGDYYDKEDFFKRLQARVDGLYRYAEDESRFSAKENK